MQRALPPGTDSTRTKHRCHEAAMEMTRKDQGESCCLLLKRGNLPAASGGGFLKSHHRERTGESEKDMLQLPGDMAGEISHRAADDAE